MRLRDRVALVTGAAKGMGGTICEYFAREGASLAMAARDVPAIEAEIKRLRGQVPGVRAIAAHCDVTDESQVQAMVAQTLQQYGRIDILLNAAGDTGPIETLAYRVRGEEWDQVLTVNAKGTFLACKYVLPHMIERKYGKIVNICGTSGMRGYKNRVAYSSSKWAVRGLTRTIALEVGIHNINVNCVSPGPLTGPRITRIIQEKALVWGVDPAAVDQAYIDEQAIKRWTTAEDVAHACVFLASDESRQITGQALTVDGGWDV
ncbi:MAG: SDR family oxidoreductase [Chloroflexi bacterium]|nr:SDR family oxidoreductase [Chloroflexota bacterium]